jgi:hypothetical protein
MVTGSTLTSRRRTRRDAQGALESQNHAADLAHRAQILDIATEQPRTFRRTVRRRVVGFVPIKLAFGGLAVGNYESEPFHSASS